MERRGDDGELEGDGGNDGERMERGRMHLQSIKTGDLWKKEKRANFFFH